MMWRPRHKARNFLPSVYLAAFFLSLHLAITTYVDSTFLATFFSEKYVGLFFAGGSLLAIFALSFAPTVLRSFGNYFVTQIFLLGEILCLIALPFFRSPSLIAVLYMLHTAFSTFLLFNFDVFTESDTKDETTGGTRGIFLTMQNLAIVLGPIVVGAILTDSQFWRVYLASAALILPVLFVVIVYLNEFKDPKYQEIKWAEGFRGIMENHDVRFITAANFLLQFFYAIMVVYTPVYLNLHMGFSWSQIGTIFGIMLLPFVFFEIPLGRIADERLGEKEILTAGFLLVSITTFSLSFLTWNSIFLWSAILFMTRVGAAAIEIMTETYFFKQINVDNVGLLSMFRHMRPISYVLGPLSASIFLYFFSLQFIYIALGLIMFLGVYFALGIRDTK